MQKLIFKQFLYKDKLKFSQIEKLTGIRSNKLAYYLKQLVAKNVLQKEDDQYSLTKESVKQITILSGNKILHHHCPLFWWACMRTTKFFLRKEKSVRTKENGQCQEDDCCLEKLLKKPRNA